MSPIAQLILPSPISLDLRISAVPRPRVISSNPQDLDAAPHVPEMHEFDRFGLWIITDAYAREIRVQLMPLPHALTIYGPEDFSAAAGDTPEDHSERVLHCLGNDPATVLQALIDGHDMPPLPPRIPREIPNWRAKVVLAGMGLLQTVDAAIAALPEPDRTVASLAWGGDAKLARRGKTVLGLAAALGLTSEQVDQLFIAAEALEV